MKWFAVRMTLLLTTIVLLNSCASSEHQFGDTGSASSGQPVPGEKAASGPDVMPSSAGGTAGARVGW